MAASAFLAAGIGGILIACGAGDSSEPSPTTNDATNGTSIGPAGGTVTENGVTVTIPAGALAAATPIHITESTVTPNGYIVSGKVYRFEPTGTHFNAPITITLPSTKPEIVYWTKDGSETEFEPVETDFDEVAATAKVQITHFSNGFVGTSPNGITCIVKQPNGCPGTKTTIESPSFWYVNKVLDTWPSTGDGAIATNSIGINRFMNTQVGVGVLAPNADRSIWKAAAQSLGDPGTAYVADGWITNFTAKASRGGVNAGSPCGFGPAGNVWAPTVDYTCSGGNVWISNTLPRPVADAGVSIDSSSPSDATADSSANDSGMSDAGATDGAGSSSDSSASDSSASEDASTGDAGSDSGRVADSGTADSGSSPSYVQGANFTFPVASTATSVYPLPFTNGVTSGDLLVVAYFWNHAIGESIVSIQDTLGSSYTKAFQVDDGVNDTMALWFVKAAQSGTNTITITVPSSTKSPFYGSVLEYSGVTALDVQNTYAIAAVTGPEIATFDSGPVTTNYSNEILIGVGHTNIPQLKTVSPFTERFVSTSRYFAVEDRVNVAAATYSAPFAIDNASSYMSKSKSAWAGIAAFR